MGVMQHLDGISGTEKQEVAFDYAQRLSIGIDNAIVSISMTSFSNININHNYSRMSSIKLIRNSYRKMLNKYPINFFVKSITLVNVYQFKIKLE